MRGYEDEDTSFTGAASTRLSVAANLHSFSVMTDSAPHRAALPLADRAAAMLRALRKLERRLERKVVAIRGDLTEAEQGPEHRRAGEVLLTYLRQVPKRASRVTLPDPANPAHSIDIELDPALTPQANAARAFKRAAKAERALEEVPV